MALSCPYIVFPLTFESEQELVASVKTHSPWFLSIARNTADTEAAAKRLALMQAEIAKLQSDRDKLQALSMERNQSVGSCIKGRVCEEVVAQILSEIGSKTWAVDAATRGKIRCMDIRLSRIDGTAPHETIGIECKDKTSITAADLSKFERDLTTNSFKAACFVSTCPILAKGVVTENDFRFESGNKIMFIYTTDADFLKTCFRLFLGFHGGAEPLDTKNAELFVRAATCVKTLYRQFQDAKKNLGDMDATINTLIEALEIADVRKPGLHLSIGRPSVFAEAKKPPRKPGSKTSKNDTSP